MTRPRPLLMRVFVVVLVAAAAAPSIATDRYFRDLSVVSPDGRHQLDARSPDNAGEESRPFARHFVYTLRDTSTGRVIWKRRQPESEGSPLALFLHDDLWVVIRDAWDRLVALEPVTGRRVGGVKILEEFPAEEQRYVHRTTAGPMWSGRARWSFLEHDGRLYFVVRAWWDRRVIMSLSDGIAVTDIPRDLLAAGDAADRQFVIDALSGPLEHLLPKESEEGHARTSNTYTAVHIAGRMNIRKVIPALRELEKSNSVGSSGGWFDIENRYKEGEVNPFNCTTAGMRRAVHLALRKLGEKPTPYPCTWFREKKTGGLGEYVEVAPLPEPRASRVDQVVTGMTPREVLASIGAPDYVNHGRLAWEYEIDATSPYTLLVIWDDEKKHVGRCERITPPLWQQGNTRYDRF